MRACIELSIHACIGRALMHSMCSNASQGARLHMRIVLKSGIMADYYRSKDISRDEMARQMGVSTTTTFRVEKGDVDPSPRFIAALILLTNEPFEALFEIVHEAAA